jgi:hypothetical protein
MHLRIESLLKKNYPDKVWRSFCIALCEKLLLDDAPPARTFLKLYKEYLSGAAPDSRAVDAVADSLFKGWIAGATESPIAVACIDCMWDHKNFLASVYSVVDCCLEAGLPAEEIAKLMKEYFGEEAPVS